MVHDFAVAAGALADKLGHDEEDFTPEHWQRHYLAKYDMTTNENIHRSLKIRQKQVLRWYNHGESTKNFDGSHTSDSIVRYILRKTGQAKHHTSSVTCEELKKFEHFHRENSI